jgi:TPR repeat protein
MKRLLPFLMVFGVFLGSAGLSWSADFEKGWKAYKNKDYATALREWRLLAEQGNVKAPFYLGEMYRHGKGVTQDFEEALNWYLLGAERGEHFAQHNAGISYRDGLGVKRNYKTAATWFQKSANQGNPWAQYELGKLYGKGLGVLQNYTASRKWFRLSAKQGEPLAQYALGLLYQQGVGGERDIISAHVWWNIAASNGHEEAMKKRDILSGLLTEQDLAKAQRVARRCIDTKYKECSEGMLPQALINQEGKGDAGNRTSADAIRCSALYLIGSSITAGNPQAAEGFMNIQQVFDRVFSIYEKKRLNRVITNGMISREKSNYAIKIGTQYDQDPSRVYALEMQCNAWREKIAAHVSPAYKNTRDQNALKEAFSSIPNIPKIPPRSHPRWAQSRALVDRAISSWTDMGRITPMSVKETLMNQ